MGWFEFLWSDEPDGNVEHLAQHGLTMDDFEHVFDHAESEGFSHTTGRPVRFGTTIDGRYICIVFEWLEKDMTVLPITAYEV